MNLMVEFPGDRVVPRERFGPRSKLFVGASSEEGVEAFVAHRQVMENLEHVDQYGDGHREQNQRLE